METERPPEQEPQTSFPDMVDRYIPKPKKRFWHRRKKTENYSDKADQLFTKLPPQQVEQMLKQIGTHPDGAHFFRQAYRTAYRDLDRKLKGKSSEETEKILAKTTEVMANYLQDLNKHVQLSLQYADHYPIPPRGLRRHLSINLGMGPFRSAKVLTQEIYMHSQTKVTELQLKLLRINPNHKVENTAHN